MEMDYEIMKQVFRLLTRTSILYYLIFQSFDMALAYPNGGIRRGHDRMIVGFITTYASSAYHY